MGGRGEGGGGEVGRGKNSDNSRNTLRGGGGVEAVK